MTEKSRWSARRGLARAAPLLGVTLALVLVGPQSLALAAAPTLTIAQPSPSSDQTPKITGTTSEEDEPVTLKIYKGNEANGELVESQAVLPVLGAWSVTAASTLTPGRYTAIAEQKSAEGGEVGTSEPVTFAIDAKPVVSINPVGARTNDSTPTLSGGAGSAEGDLATVEVNIYPGNSTAGTPVSEGSAAVSGGTWEYTSPHLADGTYTAEASQGNEVGETAHSEPVTFEVDTASPTVTLTQPVTPSNDMSPTLSGSASEDTEVVVRVFEGPRPEGKEVTKATTTAAGGSWSAGVSLPAGDHTFTAIATEASSMGNAEGTSEARTFVVNNESPTVTLTQPVTPSNDTSPTLAGSASEDTKVTVRVFEGSAPEGKEVTKATTTASGGSWSAGVSLPGGDHTFTAIATEASSLGNAEGTSEPRTFVVDNVSPTVTLAQPATPSNDTSPTLGGTASEDTEVVVRVFEGSRPEGNEVTKATTTAAGGSWSAGVSLPGGDHTFTAIATEASSLGNADGTSEPRTFVVNNGSPTVTLRQPATLSNVTTPTLGGSASEDTEVVVRVFEGSRPEGNEVTKATTTAAGGSWSAGVSLPGGDHTFTAIATEASSLGNPEGTSEARTFVVDTEPPSVTLNQPTTPSSVTTPTFSGTASEDTKVTVRVFEGSAPEGKEVTKATTSASGGSWSAAVSLSGGDHTYTAVATEASSLGNPEGESQPRTFVVDTISPTITLNQPTTPSNDTTPTLGGSASEDTLVTVRVFEGSAPEGPEVTKATTTASGGSWSVAVSLPSGGHTFTAVATEASALGNAEGTSEARTFVVDTNPPTVTLRQPTTLSNDTTPTLGGSASEDTLVTVRVFEGSAPEGPEVTKATTTASGGSWSVAVSLPSGGHTFTAVATEASALGNAEGTSEARTFVVDTNPPTVTLNQPTTPSKIKTPTLAGSASEDTKVTVRVFEGSSPEGKEVTKATTTASGGSWSAAVSLSEGDHTYTAVATEVSSLGNSEGVSEAKTFVVNTEPPLVALSQPATPSKVTALTFSGTASENGEVIVRVYEGSEPEGKEVAKATATASGGTWTSGALSSALATGEHTYTARATEASAIGNAEGKSEAKTFVVNTNPPTVTLLPPMTPSNVTSPSFSGKASENTEVVVHIYEGTKAEGTEVAKVSATGTAGAWASGTVDLLPHCSLSSPAEPAGSCDRTYTAVATEVSGLGNPAGKSEAKTFVVDTEPPAVTLNSPKQESAETEPQFSGSASEVGTVTVEIFKGSSTSGEPSETLKAELTTPNGEWRTAHVAKALANGTYTAIATEPSTITGNRAGSSAAATFEVDTAAPNVELEKIKSPSRDTTPSFAGEASGTSNVTVDVYEGSSTGGPIVAEVEAKVLAGKWKSADISKALAEGDHVYTALAFERGQETGIGKSAPVEFVVDTLPPTVTLKALPSPSNNQEPSFSGTTSESGEVTVHVYEGTKAEGELVASATAKTLSAGASWTWVSSAVKPKLKDGEYTAVAEEPSEIGNPKGTSEAVSFVIDTQAPTVTLHEVPSPSGDTTPAFSGTASDHTPVTVEVFRGGAGVGTPVASVTAEVDAGAWSTPKVATALAWGEYTAVARQPSSIAGNEEGVSTSDTFTIEQIAPSATTESSASFTQTSAYLNGYADPNGGNIEACYFEWGATTSYGREAACAIASGEEEFPHGAKGAIPVFARIFGLQPSTAYHFRLHAEDEGGGMALGGDQTFTTLIQPFTEQPREGPKAPTTSAGIGRSGVLASIAQQPVAPGKHVTIASLLKRGYYAVSFKAPEAGTATIAWYYLPPGAKLARVSRDSKSKPSPVLVASGKVTFHSATTATIKLRLTSAGKRLLRNLRRVRLTVRCSFAPAGEAPVMTTATFALKR